MGNGHEVWHVEGRKREWMWAKNNIEMDLEEIGLRILDVAEDRDRWVTL